MKKRFDFIIEGCYSIWEDGVSEVFLEPWPEGITEGTILNLSNGRRMYVVQVDPIVEEVFVQGCYNLPRNLTGWIEMEVPKPSLWARIKSLFC